MNSKRILLALLLSFPLLTSCAGWRKPQVVGPKSICHELNSEEWRGVQNLAVMGYAWRAEGDPDHMAAAIIVFGGMLKRCEPGRFRE